MQSKPTKPIEDVTDICAEYDLVTVNAEEAKIYTKLVFLLDKDAFLDDIRSIRKIAGITSPDHLAKEDVEHFIFEDMLEDESYTELPEHLKNGVIKDKCDKAIELCKPLAAKYHRTSNYELPILYATLCNQVEADDLGTKPSFKYLSADYQHTGVPEMTMVFYPETSIQDVRKVFDKIKKTMTKTYFEEIWNAEENKHDTVSRINRDRHIYWYKKMGYSWNQIIHKIDTDFGEFLDIKSATNCYKQYEKGVNNS